jgi:hypothetical protein
MASARQMPRKQEDSGSAMTRRNLLICFVGLLAAPATIVRGMSARAGGGKIVIVDGWVLLEDDLRKFAAHVA